MSDTNEEFYVQEIDMAARLKFAGIDDGTRALLPSIWQLIHPALPSVLGAFYNHLRTEPHLAGLIGEQQERLEKAQSGHWQNLFSGKFDETYVNSIQVIGNVHHRIGLEPHYYIAGLPVHPQHADRAVDQDQPVFTPASSPARSKRSTRL